MVQVEKSRASRLTRRAAWGCLAGACLGIGFVSVLAQGQAPKPIGKFIKIDGNQIYYEERGKGTPVFITPGQQQRVETLRPLAEKLALKYRVITCIERLRWIKRIVMLNVLVKHPPDGADNATGWILREYPLQQHT